jgi:hypothetical protein
MAIKLYPDSRDDPLDDHHRAGFRGAISHMKSRAAEPDIPFCVFKSKIEGGSDGTRTLALAAWCAHSGDHSVVAVLRPLIIEAE